MGATAENFESITKNLKFLTCTCKSAHHVYIQKSKVKVEHTSCRPSSSGSTACKVCRNSFALQS